MNEFPWLQLVIGLLTVLLSVAGGVIATVFTRKSQIDTNRLTASNNEFTHMHLFANEVQEERTLYKDELKELRTEFEAFKKSVQQQFSGYRAYIRGLRGQVHDLGGVPLEWPENLEQ